MWVNKSDCEYCEFHVIAAQRQAERAAKAGEKRKAAPAADVRKGATTKIDATINQARALKMQPAAKGGGLSVEAAVALLKQEGFEIVAPDPNASRQRPNLVAASGIGALPSATSFKKAPEVGDLQNRDLQHGHRRPKGDERSTDTKLGVLKRTPAPSTATTSSASAFTQQFGRLDASSAEGKKVLAARATHSKADDERVHDAMKARLGSLQKRDELCERVRLVLCIQLAREIQPQ